MLWLEFDAPLAGPQDAYFVRVLALAPVPVLTNEVIAPLVPEPALPIDAVVRHIVPLQPRDDSGLKAMQQLERQSGDGPHYLIPLPDGLKPESPELLGMFTYEVRWVMRASAGARRKVGSDRRCVSPACSTPHLRSRAGPRALRPRSVPVPDAC
jgi:hypothetical protein